MSLFLDSAAANEAREAFGLGFVSGITTNPKLLAQVGGRPEEVLRELLAISTGPVCYQLTAPTVRERQEEALRISSLAPQKLVMKVPCTTENLSLMDRLVSKHSVACAATAVFSEGQAYLACESGAKYLIPYVNRITAGGGDGPAFVARLAALVRVAGKGTEILAASLKTPEEVARTVLAGAHHVTLPLAVIQALGNDSRSDGAITEFASFDRRR